MKKYKLTIGIIYCDKDYQYINDLLKSIEEKVKVSHEVILYDNCEKNNLTLENYKVIGKNNKNEFQSKARAEILENASGEYIWFIDADDEIFEIPKKFESEINSNIVSFSSFIGENLARKINGISKVSSKTTVEFTGCQIWDKWFKIKILKEFIPKIKEKEMICGEDAVIYILALSKSDYIEYNSKTIYRYNIERSTSVHRCYSTFKNFCNILKKDRLKDIIIENTSEKWRKETGIDLFLEYEPTYLFQFLLQKNKKDWPKIINKIFERYSLEEILNSYVLFFDNIVWDIEVYNYIIKELKNRIPFFNEFNIKKIQKKFNKIPKKITFKN